MKVLLVSSGIIQAEDPCVGCPFVPRTAVGDSTCPTRISNNTVLFTVRSTEGDSCFYIFGGCRLYQVITTTNECIEYDDILSKNDVNRRCYEICHFVLKISFTTRKGSKKFKKFIY